MSDQQPSTEPTPKPSEPTPFTSPATHLRTHRLSVGRDSHSFREPDYQVPTPNRTASLSSERSFFSMFTRPFWGTAQSVPAPTPSGEVIEKLGLQQVQSSERPLPTSTKSTSALHPPLPPPSPLSPGRKDRLDGSVSPKQSSKDLTSVPIPEEEKVAATTEKQSESSLTSFKVDIDDTIEQGEEENTVSQDKRSRREANASIVSIPDAILEPGESLTNPDTTVAAPVKTESETPPTEPVKKSESSDVLSSEQVTAVEDPGQFIFPAATRKANPVLVKDVSLEEYSTEIPPPTVATGSTDATPETIIEEEQNNKEDTEAVLVDTAKQITEVNPRTCESSSQIEVSETTPEDITDKETAVVVSEIDVAPENKPSEKKTEEESTVEKPAEEKPAVNGTAAAAATLGTSVLTAGGSFKGVPKAKPPPNRSQTMAPTTEATVTSPSGGQRNFFQRLFSKKSADKLPEIPTNNEEETIPRNIPSDTLGYTLSEKDPEPTTTETEKESEKESRDIVAVDVPPQDPALNFSDAVGSPDRRSGARSPLALTEVQSETSEKPVESNVSSTAAGVSSSGKEVEVIAEKETSTTTSESTAQAFDNIKDLLMAEIKSKGIEPTNEYSKRSNEFDSPLAYLLDLHNYVESNSYGVSLLGILKKRYGDDDSLVCEFEKAITIEKETTEPTLIDSGVADVKEQSLQHPDSPKTETTTTGDASKSSESQEESTGLGEDVDKKVIEAEPQVSKKEAIENVSPAENREIIEGDLGSGGEPIPSTIGLVGGEKTKQTTKKRPSCFACLCAAPKADE